MNSFRTEITIPVNRDTRTFEERRNDIFEKLEEKYSKQRSCDRSNVISQSTSNKIINTNHETDRFFNTKVTDWDTDVSDWLISSRKKWKEEMNAIKSSMFSLDSGNDEFDFNSWDPWKDRRRSDLARPGTEIQREHIVTSSPSGNQQRREFKESVFSSSSQPMDSTDNDTHQHKELTPVYEIGQDGMLYFKLRFESKNFKPEDIKITCADSTLNICAKKGSMANNSLKNDLQKSIFIPSCVNSLRFQCHLTGDGILVLEAPVLSPEYSTIISKENRGNPIEDSSSSLKIKNTNGPVVLCDEKGKRIHLEIKTDSDYIPSDFSVTTDSNKISVKARHEVKTTTSTSFKEFSKYYEISEIIDPTSVKFNLVDGTLVIEASIA